MSSWSKEAREREINYVQLISLLPGAHHPLSPLLKIPPCHLRGNSSHPVLSSSRQSRRAGLKRETNCWNIWCVSDFCLGLSVDVIIQEEGIFDALEKQYLRSFIFAVYLVFSVLLDHLHVLTLPILFIAGRQGSRKVFKYYLPCSTRIH